MFTTYFEGKQREAMRGSLPEATARGRAVNRRLVGVDVGARPPRRCCSLGTRCTHPDPCWIARACSLWSTRYPAVQGMIVRNTTGAYRSLAFSAPSCSDNQPCSYAEGVILAPWALGWRCRHRGTL